MTKAESFIDDNGGRCESCNSPESEYQPQVAVPVRLGGDLGWGTMWKCPKCIQASKQKAKEAMNPNPYEMLLGKFADRHAYVLIYDATRATDLPILMGTWRGENPRFDTESVGPLLRQGLAGFTRDTTWMDLAEQLENSGFQRTDDARDPLRDAADIVRIVFWDDGLISCQWLTLGPDDNARSAGKPVGVLPGGRS